MKAIYKPKGKAGEYAKYACNHVGYYTFQNTDEGFVELIKML